MNTVCDSHARVAVIMSVYHKDKLDHIKEAIDSVFEQKNSPLLLFIYIDGRVGSDIYNFLHELSSSFNFVKLTASYENKGLAFALNSLIDLVLSYDNIDYIARMDSDDISLPNRILSQTSFLDNNPNVDVLGTFCHEFGEEYALAEKKLPIMHADLVNFSITRCPFIHPTVMFRRNVFDQGHRYPMNTCFTEDIEFWLELIYKNYTFHNLPDVLLKYRLEQNTISRRSGFAKAKSEISLRLGYMFLLNKCSLKNLFLIYGRFFFHMMPNNIMKLAYKYLR